MPRPTPEADIGGRGSTRVAGLVLAAGTASRFGSPKALAVLDGKPLLQHVLDVVATARLDPVVVVLGDAEPEVEAAIHWHGERRIRNPEPGRGLASSVRIGLEALVGVQAPPPAVAILLGDQPRVRVDVIEALIERRSSTDRPIVAPRYAAGGGPNPIIIDRSAFALAAALGGDRGFGPLLAIRPELVEIVDVPGSNPDVDTPADLAGLV